MKRKCSTDYSWACPACGAMVAPLSGENSQRNFCDCPIGHALAAAVDQEIAAAGLDSGQYARFRFDRWDLLRNVPSSTTAFKTVREYSDGVQIGGEDRNWLYLYGDYGLGKTHLAIATLRRAVTFNLWTAGVAVWPELCQATQESWGASHGPTEAQLWGRVRSANILLLDDLDKIATNKWAMEKLYGLLHIRLVKILPTIITSNHSLTQLQAIWRKSKVEHVRDLGLAVLSRIAEGLWGGVKFEGDDQRWIR